LIGHKLLFDYVGAVFAPNLMFLLFLFLIYSMYFQNGKKYIKLCILSFNYTVQQLKARTPTKSKIKNEFIILQKNRNRRTKQSRYSIFE